MERGKALRLLRMARLFCEEAPRRHKWMLHPDPEQAVRKHFTRRLWCWTMVVRLGRSKPEIMRSLRFPNAKPFHP